MFQRNVLFIINLYYQHLKHAFFKLQAGYQGEAYGKTLVRRLLKKGKNKNVRNWTYPIFKKRFDIFDGFFKNGNFFIQ